MLVTSVAIRMKRIPSAAYFGEFWLCLLCKVPIDGERPAYQKIKTGEQAFYQRTSIAASPRDTLILRGIKLWYLV